jgi:peptide/nickel transport system permease protein
MVEYALRRTVYGILVVFAVIVMVFLALHAVPGDPVRAQLADAPGVTDAEVARRSAQLGLDKPLFSQLLTFVGGVFTGNLGRSFVDNRSVMSEIGERLPVTLQLGVMALIISIILGFIMGMAAAVRQNTLLDHSLRVVSVSGLSIPNFWLALLMVTYFAIYLGWSPPLVYQSPTEDLGNNLSQTILPAVALGVAGMAGTARLLRSSLLEVMQSNFIRTVRARGASRATVLLKHATRNSILPVFTVLGLQVGAILGGTVILESIFSIPGLGLLVFRAVQQRDYPVVMGCVIVYATVFVVVNLVVDLAYGLIDPRVRYR